MKPILGYWDIRGLAQPIRLLLAYTETDFEDKRYSAGLAPDYDKSCWFDVKYSLGLDFPNLPYYIDDDVKLTQSNAILRYLARKNGLSASNESQQDVLENVASDFRRAWGSLCYNPKFEELKEDYLENLPRTLETFSDYLGDQLWFLEEFDVHQYLDSECLANFPNLSDFLCRFEDLPTIAAYMQSNRFLKWPLNNPIAKFGQLK